MCLLLSHCSRHRIAYLRLAGCDGGVNAYSLDQVLLTLLGGGEDAAFVAISVGLLERCLGDEAVENVDVFGYGNGVEDLAVSSRVVILLLKQPSIHRFLHRIPVILSSLIHYGRNLSTVATKIYLPLVIIIGAPINMIGQGLRSLLEVAIVLGKGRNSTHLLVVGTVCAYLMQFAARGRLLNEAVGELE